MLAYEKESIYIVFLQFIFYILQKLLKQASRKKNLTRKNKQILFILEKNPVKPTDCATKTTFRSDLRNRLIN